MATKKTTSKQKRSTETKTDRLLAKLALQDVSQTPSSSKRLRADMETLRQQQSQSMDLVKQIERKLAAKKEVRTVPRSKDGSSVACRRGKSGDVDELLSSFDRESLL